MGGIDITYLDSTRATVIRVGITARDRGELVLNALPCTKEVGVPMALGYNENVDLIT